MRKEGPMPVELYYAPINEAATIPLDELLKSLSEAGLPCRIEAESEETFWIILDGHESTLLATVKDGQFVFGTMAFSLEDDTTVIDRVAEVMLQAGYSAGDDSAYGDD
jgi:hypothetical protein